MKAKPTQRAPNGEKELDSYHEWTLEKSEGIKYL